VLIRLSFRELKGRWVFRGIFCTAIGVGRQVAEGSAWPTDIETSLVASKPAIAMSGSDAAAI
jgi:hypothetical protein